MTENTPEEFTGGGQRHLTDDDECPNCGRRTLTERGITVEYNDGSTGGATWLDCINCSWDNKGAEA